MAGHPPAPGPFVEPNLEAIEEAVRSVTFPISKRDMLEQLGDEDTVVVNGRNVDLRTLVKDLPDDFFESEAEFRGACEQLYGMLLENPPELLMANSPPTGFPDAPPPGRGGARDQPHLRDDNL